MTFFPLTAAQRDIWLDQLRLGDSPLYNIGGYVDFAGPIAQDLMQRAIELLVDMAASGWAAPILTACWTSVPSCLFWATNTQVPADALCPAVCFSI